MKSLSELTKQLNKHNKFLIVDSYGDDFITDKECMRKSAIAIYENDKVIINKDILRKINCKLSEHYGIIL